MRFSTLSLILVGLLAVTRCGASQPSFPGSASGKPRVFITDSKSWEVAGGSAGSSEGFGGAARGGARPQTVEIMKTFEDRCPGIVITIKQEKADFIVLLDHEGGKGGLRRDNKIAVFNKDGDSIFTNSTRSLGNAVKDACSTIMNHFER